MEKPEQLNFGDWGHVQAAIIQTIKQDKPLSYYSRALVHLACSNLAKNAIAMNEQLELTGVQTMKFSQKHFLMHFTTKLL